MDPGPRFDLQLFLAVSLVTWGKVEGSTQSREGTSSHG